MWRSEKMLEIFYRSTTNTKTSNTKASTTKSNTNYILTQIDNVIKQMNEKNHHISTLSTLLKYLKQCVNILQ